MESSLAVRVRTSLIVVFEVWIISSKYLAVTRESHCTGWSVLNT